MSMLSYSRQTCKRGEGTTIRVLFVHMFVVTEQLATKFHFANVWDSRAWIDSAREGLKLVLWSLQLPLSTSVGTRVHKNRCVSVCNTNRSQ